VFKDVATYALQELRIPPTGKKATKVTLKVSPEKALADPTLLRDGRKRSGG
jgi:cell division protein FtsI (penicillin-binding protein 3)